MVYIKKTKVYWRSPASGRKEKPCVQMWISEYLRDIHVDHVYVLVSLRDPSIVFRELSKLKELVDELKSASIEGNIDKIREVTLKLDRELNTIERLIEELDRPEPKTQADVKADVNCTVKRQVEVIE